MSWKDFLNPNKVKWWRKDEWVKTDNYRVGEILKEYDCPSWKIRHVKLYQYKNRDDCEERVRIERKGEYKITMFDDPREEMTLLRQVKIYEGPDYEDKQ